MYYSCKYEVLVSSFVVAVMMMYYLLYIAVVFMGHLGRLLMHFAKIWRILFMFIQ